MTPLFRTFGAVMIACMIGTASPAWAAGSPQEPGAVALAAPTPTGAPASAARASAPATIPNPAIDMAAYLRIAGEAARYRESHRISEAEFIRRGREPGTIVLDARSTEKYDELHVRGALHLSFPDIAIESLRETIPDSSTCILIYCNNNFSGALGPFPTKMPAASLNLSTFIALYTYGYRNIYELGPLIDIRDSKLEFESSRR